MPCDLVAIAGLPPMAAAGWVVYRLISTFCTAWLERSRRKTTLAIMDKAGQIEFALLCQRRQAETWDPESAAAPTNAEVANGLTLRGARSARVFRLVLGSRRRSSA
jgi:hypothetical protein